MTQRRTSVMFDANQALKALKSLNYLDNVCVTVTTAAPTVANQQPENNN